MIGIVFAAGIGSRLKPFTDSHPKALVQVAGDAVLGHAIRRLAAAGAGGVVVNVHHFPEQIRSYLAERDFGVPVEISDETGRLLDTGGALAKMARESRLLAGLPAETPVAVQNADIITDFPLADMLEQHRRSGADATVLVDGARRSTRAFLFGDDGRLRGWHNSATGQTKPASLSIAGGLRPAPFGGAHILRRGLLDTIASRFEGEIEPFSITDWYLDNCGEFRILGYTPARPYRWHDVGTLEKLAAARLDFDADTES